MSGHGSDDRRSSDDPLPVEWSWQRFERLSGTDVYDVLTLRADIFVVEQRCAFLDPDGVDDRSWHLLGRAVDGALAAYLRCVDAGIKYPEPSIGRVVVAGVRRGTGLGRALMVEGIARSRHAWPGSDIVIGAQRRLDAFYASLGFRGEGDPYDEDGIEHVKMRLTNAGSTAREQETR